MRNLFISTYELRTSRQWKKIWFWANTKSNIVSKRKNIRIAIMVGWRINVLISTIISLAAATSDVSFSRISPPGSNKLLSRKRRFFIPQTQGWALRWVIDTRSIIRKMSFHLVLGLMQTSWWYGKSIFQTNDYSETNIKKTGN